MHLIALKKTFPPEPCQDYQPWFKIQSSRSMTCWYHHCRIIQNSSMAFSQSFPLAFAVDDGTSPTIRFRSYKKKKHMVTACEFIINCNLSAKLVAFSMGTGDSLELSVTAPEKLRLGRAWPDDLVIIPGQSYPSGHESNDKPGRKSDIKLIFQCIFQLVWAKVAIINRLLISPSTPKNLLEPEKSPGPEMWRAALPSGKPLLGRKKWDFRKISAVFLGCKKKKQCTIFECWESHIS